MTAEKFTDVNIMNVKTANRKMLVPGGDLYVTSFDVDVPAIVKNSMVGKLDNPIVLKDGIITDAFDDDLYGSFLAAIKRYLAGNEPVGYSGLDLGYNFEKGRYEVTLQSKRPVNLSKLESLIADHFDKVQKVIEAEKITKVR